MSGNVGWGKNWPLDILQARLRRKKAIEKN